MTSICIAGVVPSSLLSPSINESSLFTICKTILITVVAITSMKYCTSVLTMWMLGLTFITTVTILYVLPVVAPASPPTKSSSATDEVNNDPEGNYTPIYHKVPFILIRDTVAVSGGGCAIQKPVDRALYLTLEGYQKELTQALIGLSQMLERALELEDDTFQSSRNDGIDENKNANEDINNSNNKTEGNNIFPPRSARLSTRIQERIHRSSVCLEQDGHVLQRLLGTFHYVMALPDDDQRGMEGKEIPSPGEDEQRRFEEASHTTTSRMEGSRSSSSSSSSSSSPPQHKSIFRLVPPGGYDNNNNNNINNRAMLELDLHSYDSASQIVAHIVRDWTVIGGPIRLSLYDWCCNQVETYLPPGSRGTTSTTTRPLSILVPGAGMGRLAYDLYNRGHNVEANELSPSMAAAASAILTRRVKGTLHPFVLDSMNNEVNSNRRFDAVPFPDVDIPSNQHSGRRRGVNGQPLNGSLSYTVGNFVGGNDDSYYYYRTKSGQYDAIVTCFFIDTASNLYEYIDMIQSLVKPGIGVWINVGPVQWHQHAQLRPSVDELKDLLLAMGWSIKLWSIDRTPISYRESDNDFVRATNYDGYRPLRFVAIRSNGVY
jgi:hypothetical protein